MNGHPVAEEALGRPGTMLSGLKRNPPGTEDHTIYWNACVFQDEDRHLKHWLAADAIQIWHGDLDLTAQHDNLQHIADTIAATIYVTPEHPWRFNGFKSTFKLGRYNDRVVRFDPR